MDEGLTCMPPPMWYSAVAMDKHSKSYRHFYHTRQWKAVRQQQLDRVPLCEWCTKDGKTTVAVVVHHLIPHKGDWNRFITGPFASLCADHHDDQAKEIEYRGYHGAVGTDGYPLDPNHPANRRQ